LKPSANVFLDSNMLFNIVLLENRMARPREHANCNCGWSGLVRRDTYKANIKKNGVYLCQKCAAKLAGVTGKYSGSSERRSEQSKTLWKRSDFRAKITAASIAANTTDEYKKQQSIRTLKLWTILEYRTKIINNVKTALATPETREKISIGLRQRWLDNSYRIAALNNLSRQKTSSLQTILYEYLTNLGVEHHKEGPNTTIGFYSFDCLIPHKPRSILIECQGDYWHSLPKAIRNDRSKFTYIQRYFPEYEIMYIWEHEFATKDRVLDRLKLKLNLAIETTQFKLSQLYSNQLSREESNKFLSKYHYLTSSRGGTDFGLWLENKLIAVSRFSPLPRQNMAHQFPPNTVELARLCVHPNYHKHNLLSWWLAKLVKNYKAVIAFADTTVGHTGAVYKAANFKLHHQTNPDYWYVDKDGFVMHKKTLYNRAVNLKLTESQFAEKFGYIKKWGGPKLCFIYEPSH